MYEFDFRAPRTWQEAFSLLDTPRAQVIAGGTDLIPLLRSQEALPRLLIDLHRLPGLQYIHRDDGLVQIGAMATHADLVGSALCASCAPALMQAARSIGPPQIRNRGTLGGNIVTASPAGDTLPPDDLPSESGPGLPHNIFCFGAQVAAVEVDVDLGTVAVTDVAAIHDLGLVINPPAAVGQIEGGIGQGVGYALCEELQKREDGHWANTFAEYLLPTALDTPRIEAEFIEYPEPSSPFGAKGAGEQGTVPTASAIANAIADAVGVRVTKLPVDPETILRQSAPRE